MRGQTKWPKPTPSGIHQAAKSKQPLQSARSQVPPGAVHNTNKEVETKTASMPQIKGGKPGKEAKTTRKTKTKLLKKRPRTPHGNKISLISDAATKMSKDRNVCARQCSGATTTTTMTVWKIATTECATHTMSGVDQDQEEIYSHIAHTRNALRQPWLWNQ